MQNMIIQSSLTLERRKKKMTTNWRFVVSPTRKYILLVEDPLDPLKENVYKVTLPQDVPANNGVEAGRFFNRMLNFNNLELTINEILTYENYADKILAKTFDDPEDIKAALKKKKSPSRTYVLFVEDVGPFALPWNLNHIYKIVVPDEYENSETGAKMWFYDRYDIHIKINNCLTYESYRDIFAGQTLIFDDPEKRNLDPRSLSLKQLEKEKEAPTYVSDFTSPTRTYVVFYEDPSDTTREKIIQITVTDLYVNDVTGAMNYYRDRLSSTVKVHRCLPYEYHIREIKAKEVAQSVPDKNDLLAGIKVSLAEFYKIERYIEDEEVLNLLGKLEHDNMLCSRAFDILTPVFKKGEQK